MALISVIGITLLRRVGRRVSCFPTHNEGEQCMSTLKQLTTAVAFATLGFAAPSALAASDTSYNEQGAPTAEGTSSGSAAGSATGTPGSGTTGTGTTGTGTSNMPATPATPDTDTSNMPATPATTTTPGDESSPPRPPRNPDDFSEADPERGMNGSPETTPGKSKTNMGGTSGGTTGSGTGMSGGTGSGTGGTAQ